MTGLYGPDVSTFDASFPSGQWAFTYIRRSIGLQKDDKSDAHMAAARAQKVARCGWYHYVTAGTDPDAQAAFFLEHAQGADFLVADIEGATSDAAGSRFIASVKRSGLPCIEYVQGSRRYVNRGADGQIVAAWGLPALAVGAIGWQAWSEDWTLPNGLHGPVPAWVPEPARGDWDQLLDAPALDSIIARHKGQGGASVPFNLVPITCHRRVALKAGTVLYEQDRKTTYTTLAQDTSLGYVAAADATWALIADGDALCYVKRSQFGPISTADVSVGA